MNSNELDEHTNTLLPNFKEKPKDLHSLIRQVILITDDHKIERIVKYMVGRELLEPRGPTATTFIFTITNFGTKVLTEGGWNKYLEIQKEVASKETQRKELEYEQLKLQIQTLRRELRNNKLWWILGSGIVSLIVSLLSNNFEFILKFFGLIGTK